MSRTKKGKKSPGLEYWGKRPYAGASPSPTMKKLTHKKERALEKELLLKEKKKLELK